MFSRDKSRAPRKVHVTATAQGTPSPASRDDDDGHAPLVRLYDDPEAMAQARREVEARNAAKDASLAPPKPSPDDLPHSAASKPNPWTKEGAALADSLFEQYSSEKRRSVALEGSRKSRISIFAPKKKLGLKDMEIKLPPEESHRRKVMKDYIKRTQKTADEIKSKLNEEQLEDLEFQTWLMDLVEEQVEEPQPRGCVDWLFGVTKQEEESARTAAEAFGVNLEAIESAASKAKDDRKAAAEREKKAPPPQTAPEPKPAPVLRDRRAGDASHAPLTRERAATKIQAVARMFRTAGDAERLHQVRAIGILRASPQMSSLDMRGRDRNNCLTSSSRATTRRRPPGRTHAGRSKRRWLLSPTRSRKQNSRSITVTELAGREISTTVKEVRSSRATTKTARDPPRRAQVTIRL